MGRDRSRVVAGSCVFGSVHRSTGRGALVEGRGLYGSYSKEGRFGGHLLLGVQVGGVQTALTPPRSARKVSFPPAEKWAGRGGWRGRGGRGGVRLELDFEDGSGEGNTTAS